MGGRQHEKQRPKLSLVQFSVIDRIRDIWGAFENLKKDFYQPPIRLDHLYRRICCSVVPQNSVTQGDSFP